MRSGEREIETSAAMVELETQQAVERARRALETVPADDCVDCGDEIGAGRRAAMPLARRCTRCQQIRDAAERRGSL